MHGMNQLDRVYHFLRFINADGYTVHKKLNIWFCHFQESKDVLTSRGALIIVSFFELL